MSHEHEHCHHEGKGLHIALKLVKLGLKAATVAAGFCIAKEIHKVHKEIAKK